MDILLHTIALEPARWTATKVHRPLAELLPAIAAGGFGRLEIFEPHLALAADEGALVGLMKQLGLTPVVLSSYLDLSPNSCSDVLFAVASESLLARVDRFGFRKVRFFPGRSPSADEDAKTIQGVAARLRHLAKQRPTVQFLIETHDHSLADDPQNMLRLLETCGCDNVRLVWQPTRFEPEAARAQFELQKLLTGHFHLQNRDARNQFVTLDQGRIRWDELLAELDFAIDGTLEFVPRGICNPNEFDLAATVAEAVTETAWIKELTTTWNRSTN